MILSIGGYTHDVNVVGVQRRRSIGGPPYYHSQAAKRLRIDLSIASPVGGDFNISVSNHIYTGFLEVYVNRETLKFTNIYRGSDRAQRVDGGGYRLSVKPTYRFISLLEPSHIVFSPVLDEVPLELLKIASETYPISLDIQGYVRRVEEGNIVLKPPPREVYKLRYTVFKASIEEAGKVNLYKVDADVLLITMGAKGAYVIHKDSSFYVPAYREARDPTGAGDFFFITFVNAYLRGVEPVEAAVEAASRTAEFLGVSTYEEAWKVINQGVEERETNILFGNR